MNMRRDELLMHFLSNLMNPDVYSLDSFWAENADIETLETVLISTYMQLENLC
jgi:hypothetical protein